MGYAQQRTQQYADALESYRRADILQSDNGWTLRHMAQCLRLTSQPAQALKILLQAEKLAADNLSLQIQIGDCMVDLRQYDDALTRFFKVDYLKPDYPKAWRAIAWCAFLAGRMDTAREYYDKLLKAKPTGIDCLNAGHAYFVDGNIQHAVSLYRQSRKALGQEQFDAEFEKDRPILIEKGISEQDIPLLLDLL
jgi:tetratricopeptide (TPR) repeat protein